MTDDNLFVSLTILNTDAVVLLQIAPRCLSKHDRDTRVNIQISWFAMLKKYVLCRPDAGLNDILCQIETAYQYAKQTGRITVIDTGYKYSTYFHDDFSNYFSSLDDNLVLNPYFLQNSLESMATVPSVLQGRLNSYTPQWSQAHGNYVDLETGTPISFDLTRHYDQDILVRHTCGGNDLSILALGKLVLRESITEALAQRINTIGRPFGALHIRNTDYQTDYHHVIDQMVGSILFPVFIATDSLRCRQHCENVFGRHNVIYFSDLPKEELPIHYGSAFRSPFVQNSEAILDLLTLALSSEYYKIPIRSDDGIEKYSGFSNLAENLIRNSNILISLLGKTDSAVSIVEKVTTWQSRNH